MHPLRQRFGGGLQAVASVTFLFTRLLAEGVRLFASAIPIKLLLDAIGMPPGVAVTLAMGGLPSLTHSPPVSRDAAPAKPMLT